MPAPAKHGIAITFPDGKDQYFLLSPKEISIGRAKENVITVPSSTVSSSHCVIRPRGKSGSSFELADSGSTNGTHLNEEFISADDDARELRDGDTFLIGLDVKARFFQIKDTAPPTPKQKPDVAAVAGAVTAKLQEIKTPYRQTPAINPVAAAVARAEKGNAKTAS